MKVVRLVVFRFWVWGGGEDRTVLYLIVGSLVSLVLFLPYCAFLIGVCYRAGVWVKLAECLLRSVRMKIRSKCG